MADYPYFDDGAERHLGRRIGSHSDSGFVTPDPDQGKLRQQGWGYDLPTNQPIEPENLGLGDQPTRPLADDPGPVPERILGQEIGDSTPFKQYLIAVGALGEIKPAARIGRLLHDTGMDFAHHAGLDPLLCVGYVSEAAHQADYLSASTVWHTHLSAADHERFATELPKLYVALTLLFGQPTPIGAQKG